MGKIEFVAKKLSSFGLPYCHIHINFLLTPKFLFVSKFQTDFNLFLRGEGVHMRGK